MPTVRDESRHWPSEFQAYITYRICLLRACSSQFPKFRLGKWIQILALHTYSLIFQKGDRKCMEVQDSHFELETRIYSKLCQSYVKAMFADHAGESLIICLRNTSLAESDQGRNAKSQVQ